MADKYLITLDRDSFAKYEKKYFAEKPRARIFPFRKNKTKTKKLLYGVLSLNELLPINSMSYKTKKEQWGLFGKWICEQHGYTDLNLTNAVFEIRVFSETKANKDVDNIAGGSKLLSDGLFVQSGMFIDDNYNHINPLLVVADYDKNNPRTEIRLTVIDEDIKDCYEKMMTHIKEWKK